MSDIYFPFSSGLDLILDRPAVKREQRLIARLKLNSIENLEIVIGQLIHQHGEIVSATNLLQKVTFFLNLLIDFAGLWQNYV